MRVTTLDGKELGFPIVRTPSCYVDAHEPGRLLDLSECFHEVFIQTARGLEDRLMGCLKMADRFTSAAVLRKADKQLPPRHAIADRSLSLATAARLVLAEGSSNLWEFEDDCRCHQPDFAARTLSHCIEDLRAVEWGVFNAAPVVHPTTRYFEETEHLVRVRGVTGAHAWALNREPLEWIARLPRKGKDEPIPGEYYQSCDCMLMSFGRWNTWIPKNPPTMLFFQDDFPSALAPDRDFPSGLGPDRDGSWASLQATRYAQFGPHTRNQKNNQ